MNACGCAQPSTLGPKTMPRSSSKTTIGTRTQRPECIAPAVGRAPPAGDDEQRRLERVHALTLAMPGTRTGRQPVRDQTSIAGRGEEPPSAPPTTGSSVPRISRWSRSIR